MIQIFMFICIVVLSLLDVHLARRNRALSESLAEQYRINHDLSLYRLQKMFEEEEQYGQES